MEHTDLSIHMDKSLKDGLRVIDKSGMGALFIIDHDGRLKGVLTDGDIRRALLADVSLDEKVGKIMGNNFVSLPNDTENSAILEQINKMIRIIPLVDENGVLVDYASIDRLRRISIASPSLEGNELANVTDCIRSNRISSRGKYVKKFEEDFSGYHKRYSALAVSNATAALHLALEVLGIGEGDEVLVPNLAPPASVNAILYTGAIPVLIDVEKDTWNMDPEKAEESVTAKTKAILAVHLYGQPLHMEKVNKIAQDYKLRVIEDCSFALGSRYRNEPVGVYGNAAIFSFVEESTITTGEGGMLIFKDRADAEKAAVLRDQGRNREKEDWHEQVGYNYALTNLQAAIGVAQFERLESFVSSKRKAARTYTATLSKYTFFQTPLEAEGTTHSQWRYTFLVNENAPFTQKDLVAYLSSKGIETRPILNPLHLMPPYREFAKTDLKNSIHISENGISLPSSPSLSEYELQYICDCIADFVGKKDFMD